MGIEDIIKAVFIVETKQAVQSVGALDDALRATQLSMAKTFNDAKKVLGIDQADPSKKTKKVFSAQQLLNQAIAEGASETKRYGDNMSKWFSSSQTGLKKTNWLMSILNDQGRSIGTLMGLLFGGMTLKRYGQSMMRFVLPNMEKMNNYTSEGTKRVLGMKASFEFLKFSMFEAFTSTPMFRAFVDAVMWASDLLAKLVSQNPGVTMLIAGLAGALTALGTAFTLLSTPFQMMMLYKALFGAKDAAAAAGGLKSVNTPLSNFTKNLDKLASAAGVMGGITLFIYAGVEFLNADNLTDQIGMGLASAIGLTGALGITAGWFSGGVGLSLVVMGTALLLITKNRVKIVESVNRLGLLESYAKMAGLDVENNKLTFEQKVEIGLFGYQGGQSNTAKQIAEDYDVALSTAVSSSAYNEVVARLEEISAIKSELDAGTASSIPLSVEDVSRLQTEIEEFKDAGRLSDEFFDSKIANYLALQRYEDVKATHDAESLSRDERAIQIEKAAKDAAVDKYATILAETAKSKEKTADYIENITLLGATVESVFPESILPYFMYAGELWDEALTKLNAFATALDEWAAKVVTKTVRIRYVNSNSSKDAGSFDGAESPKAYSGAITGAMAGMRG